MLSNKLVSLGIRVASAWNAEILFQTGRQPHRCDHGVHDLPDVATAHAEAKRLAQTLIEGQPELIGRHCSVSVTDEAGAGVRMVPLPETKPIGRASSVRLVEP